MAQTRAGAGYRAPANSDGQRLASAPPAARMNDTGDDTGPSHRHVVV